MRSISSILSKPGRLALSDHNPNSVQVRFIVLSEGDVDVEFDDAPWRRDGTVLLVKGEACFIADRNDEGEIANPRQLTVPEALCWWVEMASRSQGSSSQPIRLVSLAARLLEAEAGER